MRKWKLFRTELLVGPMTAPEMSAITGLSSRHCSANLCALRQQGEVQILGSFTGDTGQEVCIYGLTERGHALAIRDSRIANAEQIAVEITQ